MKTIVVGVDGSPASIAALEWAEALSPDEPTTIRVVHSWAPAMTPTSLAMPEEELHAEAGRALEAALADVADVGGRRTHVIVRDISPAAALLDQSADADLLVTGTRGLNRFERLLLGSVAMQCVQYAPCPFVAVPADSPPLGTGLTLGYDDSETSKAALRWAADWAAHGFASLRVVTVAEQHGWLSRLSNTPPAAEQALETLKQQVGAVLGRSVDHIDFHVADDDDGVVEALVGAANGTSAMAVGSRGLGGFKGLLLGSVSQRCLELSPRPVAVIREY